MPTNFYCMYCTSLLSVYWCQYDNSDSKVPVGWSIWTHDNQRPEKQPFWLFSRSFNLPAVMTSQVASTMMAAKTTMTGKRCRTTKTLRTRWSLIVGPTKSGSSQVGTFLFSQMNTMKYSIKSILRAIEGKNIQVWSLEPA